MLPAIRAGTGTRPLFQQAGPNVVIVFNFAVAGLAAFHHPFLFYSAVGQNLSQNQSLCPGL